MFQSWRHQKRSNSARLPHVSKLTTSKTKQFCETSSFFELDNIKNAAIQRDFINFWTWQRQKRRNSARLPHFLPRASERRVLPIVGVCLSSSHLHIFSSSQLLIFTSSHLHIFSSSHLLTSHLLIFTSSHLHIFSSSHLHIASAHLHIFASSHLHILTSSHLLVLPSWPLALLPSSSHLLILTSSHLHLYILTSSHLLLLPSCPSCPSCPLLLFYFSSEGGGRGSANETARNATLSHETRFDRQKLR